MSKGWKSQQQIKKSMKNMKNVKSKQQRSRVTIECSYHEHFLYDAREKVNVIRISNYHFNEIKS